MNPYMNQELPPGMTVNYEYQYNPQSTVSSQHGQVHYHQGSYTAPSMTYYTHYQDCQGYVPVQADHGQVYFPQQTQQLPQYTNDAYMPAHQPLLQYEFHNQHDQYNNHGQQISNWSGGRNAHGWRGRGRGRGSKNHRTAREGHSFGNYTTNDADAAGNLSEGNLGKAYWQSKQDESDYHKHYEQYHASDGQNNEHSEHEAGHKTGQQNETSIKTYNTPRKHTTAHAEAESVAVANRAANTKNSFSEKKYKNKPDKKDSRYNYEYSGNGDLRDANYYNSKMPDERQWHHGHPRQNWRGNYQNRSQDYRGRGRGGRYNRGGWTKGAYPQNYQSRFSSRIDSDAIDERVTDSTDTMDDSLLCSAEDKRFEVKKGVGLSGMKFKETVDPTLFDKKRRTEDENKWKRRGEKVETAMTSRGKGRSSYQGFMKHGKGSAEDMESQRGMLMEQLSGNSYECMVCCDVVRREAAIWSCVNCHHVFHLRCVKRWARSPAAAVDGTTGWRCPACQNVVETFPHHYYCFCGKAKDPEFSRYDIPHSCGEICAKPRPLGCTHPCNILCHPGPCPACHASVTKKCNCGSTTQTVKCGQAANIQCKKICGKALNCGKHECDQVCHAGPCLPCDLSISQACYCDKMTRDVLCGTAESFVRNFSCQDTCQRQLDCGNHKCERTCHPGSCDSCELLPSAVDHCPCGKATLVELADECQGKGQRLSCTDPIPTCGQICEKELTCGPEDEHHKCRRSCHEGNCGPCEGQTEVTCHCGSLTKDIPCQEAITYSAKYPFKCDKRCNRKRICGRHRCAQQCCMDTEHPCDMICGRKLTCSLHRCEEPCHRGNCPTCWHVSFEELHCQCGAEVLFPPIPCGTRPPECRKTCQRTHNCDHPVRHNCHSDENCPPCTFLTEKWCMGRHELRKNIACHLVDISCGMPCGRLLSCGQHKCQTICHKGDCLQNEEDCRQPCQKKREDCGHPCGTPCHGDDPCPPTPCQTEITLKCKCGNRTGRALCLQGGESKDVARDYQKMATMMMAMKMADVQDGQGIDISGLTTQTGSKGPRELECTKDCAVAERNKRLAEALEIKNPEQGKLTTTPYTQFLKDFAKQNAAIVANIEKAFGELVQKAQFSKQARRSHAFPPMNRDQRRAVHELAEYYGCQTQSYDEEPKKNVVATAQKDKCWLPNASLTSLVQREVHRKAPMPIPHGVAEAEVRTVAGAVKQSTNILGGSRSGSWASKVQSAGKPAAPPPLVANTKLKASGLTTLTKKKEELPVVDYFDMTS